MENKETKLSCYQRVILSFDIGSTTGIAVYMESLTGKAIYKIDEYQIRKLSDMFNISTLLIAQYKPDIILTVLPVRFYNTLVKHSKLVGLLEYAAEQVDCGVVEISESHAKKIVFGTGKVTKADIMNRYHGREHESDALMFIESFLLDIED